MAKKAIQKRRNGGRKGPGSKKIPLGVVIGMLPGISFAMASPEKSFRQGMERILWSYTGVVSWESPIRWDGSGLRYGLFPLLGGVLVHYLANVTGINRAIAKIPLVQV